MKKILTLQTKLVKFFLIVFSTLLLLFFLLLALRLKPQSSKIAHRSSSEERIKAEEEIKQMPSATHQPTQLEDFNLHGVIAFKDLFFHKDKYLIADPFQEVNPKSLLDSKETYPYFFETCSLDDLKKSSLPTRKILGTTFIFSSVDDLARFQGHYYHFCEEFLLAWCAHKRQQTPPISLILFPNTENWKGKFNHINKNIINSTAPKATVISAALLKSLSKKYILQFEHAIFVDRKACHKNEVVAAYNQMALAHRSLLKKEYLDEFKEILLTSFKTYPTVSQKPYITYIRRSTYRYLEPNFEKKLLSDLTQQFPDYRLNPVWLENYSFPEQLQIIRNSKVLIGAHGNGLTHALFLPENSLVIEIFPKDAYTMDYLYFSELAHHTYFALDPEKGVIAQTGSRIAHHGDLNQIIPEFNTESITHLLQDYFSSEKAETLKEMSLEK